VHDCVWPGLLSVTITLLAAEDVAADSLVEQSERVGHEVADVGQIQERQWNAKQRVDHCYDSTECRFRRDVTVACVDSNSITKLREVGPRGSIFQTQLNPSHHRHSIVKNYLTSCYSTGSHRESYWPSNILHTVYVLLIYPVSPKNRPPFYFLNNSRKN